MKGTEMTIQYTCNTAEDSCMGKCDSKSEMLEIFEQFLDNHGTGCDDYDEFHCRFVKEVK